MNNRKQVIAMLSPRKKSKKHIAFSALPKKVGLKMDPITTEPCLNYRSLKKTVGVTLL